MGGAGYGKGVASAVGAGGRGSGSGSATLGRKQVAASAKVVPQRPEVHGTLDKRIIRMVIRGHEREIRFCYDERRRSKPNLSGRVVLQLTIAPSGEIKEPSTKSETLSDEKLEECIRKQARQWTLPAVKYGDIFEVNYPYVFSPPPSESGDGGG